MPLSTYVPTALPEVHPDPLINAQLLVEELCGKVNTASQACDRVLDLDLVTPRGLAAGSHARHALAESDPATLSEQHCNCG